MYNPLRIFAKHVSFAGFGMDRRVCCILICAGTPPFVATVYFYLEMLFIIFVPKI
jgi:hypothetical protein